MHRKILPVTVIALSLTLVLALVTALRLSADTTRQSQAPASVPLSADSADFQLDPPMQGRFIQPGLSRVFTVALNNTGTAPTDTFEVTIPAPTWPITLYGPDGTTPLTDTNDSGSVDTGVIATGETFLIKAEVTAPTEAIEGDASETLLQISSTISPSLSMMAVIQSAVPAPFAQTLYQRPNRSLSLLMSGPDGEQRRQVTSDGWYGEGTTFPDLAVSETSAGYFYIWSNLRYIDEIWRGEVEYRFTDLLGAPSSPLAKLTNHTLVTADTYDSAPAAAVTADGQIGVTWLRRIKESDGSENYNVFLAILDANGQPITDTINLTNNSQWRASPQPDPDVPAFNSPRIAASEDGRFMVAWTSSVMTYTETISEPLVLDDIYYAIYTSDGISVTQSVNVSENLPGDTHRALAPALTAHDADLFFLTWAQRRPAEQGNDTVKFTVIDSGGTSEEPPTDVTTDDLPREWSNYDVVELSGGDLLLAWQAYGCAGYEWSGRIRYAIIKAINYKVVAGQPACLPPTVIAQGGDAGVSLVADDSGGAILTWTDRDAASRSKLYYALLDSNGNLATDPMIFHQSSSSDALISTGLHGYASASRRLFRDATVTLQPSTALMPADEAVGFTIHYGNLGTLPATGVSLTLTLAPSLTYDSDTAPVGHAGDGQNTFWNLADMEPLSDDSFDVYLSLTGTAELQSSYPLTVSISIEEEDVNLANNSAQAMILSKRPLYLPFIIRSE